MPKVFISHSSKDKPFVRKLKEDLNFNEIETWLDEDELQVGDKLYDSLMLGLAKSTHFLIVLSNNINGSEWVEAEIKEAISSFDKKILKKIIPVVFRKTKIPVTLQTLFRADFSSITFTLNGDKVHFVGDDYHKEIAKIIKAVKQSTDYTLSESEKTNIVNEADKQTINQQNKIVASYEILGFISDESRFQYVENMKSKNKNKPLNTIPTKNVIPVILPSLLKPLFGKLALGDKISFSVHNGKKYTAHFCGFSYNNSRIIIPGEIRKVFRIEPKNIVMLEVNGNERSITFLSVIGSTR